MARAAPIVAVAPAEAPAAEAVRAVTAVKAAAAEAVAVTAVEAPAAEAVQAVTGPATAGSAGFFPRSTETI